MKIIGVDKARKRLAQHLTECERTGEPLCITTQKKGCNGEPQQMVIIRKAQYDMMINKINGDK